MKKKIKLRKLLILIKNNTKINNDIFISNVSDLATASKSELVFFSNLKYLNYLKTTKASACILKKNHIKYLPKTCLPIISNFPEIDFVKITNFFYQNNDLVAFPSNIFGKFELDKKFKNILFGKNFICSKNVKIGSDCKIGHNVIIDCSSIGKNTIIGNNVVISNSLIGNNVHIFDSTIIGKKGFGFKIIDGKVIKIPHIGKVIIEDNCEIGSNCNIDRGSIKDTVIKKNTHIDNQVQIAHNVVIGENCIIASQVGIAGSTSIGNNVSIGGQVGISGHLVIGNNVKIGGKSGVIKNLDDNKIVIGYPAVDFKEFVRKNRKNEK